MTFTKVLLIRVTFTVPKVIFYSSRNTDIPVKKNQQTKQKPLVKLQNCDSLSLLK